MSVFSHKYDDNLHKHTWTYSLEQIVQLKFENTFCDHILSYLRLHTIPWNTTNTLFQNTSFSNSTISLFQNTTVQRANTLIFWIIRILQQVEDQYRLRKEYDLMTYFFFDAVYDYGRILAREPAKKGWNSHCSKCSWKLFKTSNEIFLEIENISNVLCLWNLFCKQNSQ